jgi:hypothetical protein
MAWWIGRAPVETRDRAPQDDNVTLVEEHVLLIRRPVPRSS